MEKRDRTGDCVAIIKVLCGLELQYKVRAYNPRGREIRFEILVFLECGESNLDWNKARTHKMMVRVKS